TANALNLFTVPKLAQDGSNWITYKERMHMVLGTRGLMQHLVGTAHRESAKPEPGFKPDPLASLSDDDYFAKIEAAETKIDDYEQKEFVTHQQIYRTITDSLLLKVKDLPSASAIWSAVMKEHEGKSEM
ncbi:hypothetical protein BD413DRAFT_453297, partial [Trametes elegans]